MAFPFRVSPFSFRFGATTAVSLALAFCALTPVAKAESAPSEQYLALRRAYPPQGGLTLTVLGRNPNAYKGKTLEIEGRLSGIVRAGDDSALLMLSTTQNGTLTLQMTSLPSWVNAGERLRVLVVATGGEPGEVRIGIPDLQVVAVASASDIAAAEASGRAAGNARASRIASASSRPARGSSRIAALPSRYAAPPRFRSSGGVASAAAPSAAGTAAGGLSSDAIGVYAAYRNFIVGWNKRLTDREADAITSSILSYSERLDLDPRLIIALIIAESDFDPRSTSRAGAMGLAQIMPDEASRLGLTNPYDPVQNIGGAIFLLKERLNKYSNGAAKEDYTMKQITLALASYNAGMGAVKKYGGVPPYRETQNYVKKIHAIYKKLCAAAPGAAGQGE